MKNPSNPITPLTPAQVGVEQQQVAKEGFVERSLVAIDQCANTLLGGPPDETISTRAAIDSEDGHGLSKEVGKIVSAGLNLFQKDHGAKAAAGDLERAQAEQKIVRSSGIA
jgi:hypothetical protein